MTKTRPIYLETFDQGGLARLSSFLNETNQQCTLCPRRCRTDRSSKQGLCGASSSLRIASYGPHFGEEDILVGTHGSGTIFFSHCTLQCVFCQNYDISCEGGGSDITARELAEIMCELQAAGCHNINLVSPTHYLSHIVEALAHAVEHGLEIPLVYNTSGYEDPGILRTLDGVIDIYMPDIKFGDDRAAAVYTGVDDYFTVAKSAVLEMHRQVGSIKTDKRGIAYRGLLIRHLVLPGDLAVSRKVIEFISDYLPKDTVVNIMSQYYPEYRAFDYPELTEKLNVNEFSVVKSYAEALGLTRLI